MSLYTAMEPIPKNWLNPTFNGILLTGNPNVPPGLVSASATTSVTGTLTNVTSTINYTLYIFRINGMIFLYFPPVTATVSAAGGIGFSAKIPTWGSPFTNIIQIIGGTAGGTATQIAVSVDSTGIVNFTNTYTENAFAASSVVTLQGTIAYFTTD